VGQYESCGFLLETYLPETGNIDSRCLDRNTNFSYRLVLPVDFNVDPNGNIFLVKIAVVVAPGTSLN
jgi:hypothetical protein